MQGYMLGARYAEHAHENCLLYLFCRWRAAQEALRLAISCNANILSEVLAKSNYVVACQNLYELCESMAGNGRSSISTATS